MLSPVFGLAAVSVVSDRCSEHPEAPEWAAVLAAARTEFMAPPSRLDAPPSTAPCNHALADRKERRHNRSRQDRRGGLSSLLHGGHQPMRHNRVETKRPGRCGFSASGLPGGDPARIPQDRTGITHLPDPLTTLWSGSAVVRRDVRIKSRGRLAWLFIPLHPSGVPRAAVLFWRGPDAV